MFNPVVLRWARERAFGPRIEALTIKLKTSWKTIGPDVIRGWENGTIQPTFADIRKLAKIYKRSLAVFFLDSPPDELSNPPDRRTIGSRDNEDISPKGLLVIRKARRTQAISEGLYEELGESPSFKYPKYSIRDSAEVLAAGIRSDFSISLREQTRFKKFEDFFEYLRTKIENTGVITLKMGGSDTFPIKDCRAFSLTDPKPYVIVINNADYEGAKNFSLAHEFAHILLREPGICNNFRSFETKNGKINELEVFCNQFAANLLLPKDDFLSHSALKNKKRIEKDEFIPIVKELALDFKVSRVVVLRRMLTLDLIDKFAYAEKIDAWDKEILPRRKKGGSFSVKTIIQKNGMAFSSLVAEAYRQNKISYAAISDYLNINRKHVAGFIERLHSYGR